jgi:hypothetical protein
MATIERHEDPEDEEPDSPPESSREREQIDDAAWSSYRSEKPSETDQVNGGYDGTFFQRGPRGQVPDGLSIDGVSGEYGSVSLEKSRSEHVTMYGKGWHRSWDNPGTTKDHFTEHPPRNRADA